MIRLACLAGAAFLICGGVAHAKVRDVSWTRTPADRFRCTKYHLGDAAPFAITVPPGKKLTFKLGAKAGRAKVTFSSPDLPVGASLGARSGRFRWTTEGAAGTRLVVTFVATSSQGRTATFALGIEIASDDLRLAWKAGMGTVDPDCPGEFHDWQLADVDGDGSRDVLFRTVVEDYMKLTVIPAEGSGWGEPIDVYDGQPFHYEVEPGPGAKPLLVFERDCCCIGELEVVRIAGGSWESLASGAQVDSCERGGKHELVRDGRGRVKGYATTVDGKTETFEVP